jgi:hypothetical protein
MAKKEGKTKTASVVSAPDKFRDSNWQVKIERAKAARREGAKLREGKAKTFSVRRAVSDER